ncbi:MAG: WD40 repeat domain-containing protein [Rhodospirillales bacterium]|nr:WD40 repeat domain-containing protein [Rhodospirillales bacterium]
MYGDVAENPDAGLRVQSSKVDLSEAGFGAYVTYAGFTGSGTHSVFAFGDGRLGWMAVDEGPEKMELTEPLGATPLTGVPDIDGRSVLIGTDDGRLLTFAPETGTAELASIPGAWIEQVASHPRAGLRAFSAGRGVYVLDQNGTTLAVFDDHPSTVAGLSFSPDGDRLAAAHYDGVSIWAVNDPDLSKTEPETLEWHGSHTAVSWSPDGQFIVTAMQDKEMHCWKMPEKTDMKMSGYPSKIRSLAWTPDSAYIAASGAGGVTSWCCKGKGPSGKPPLEFGYVYEGIVTQVAAHPENGMLVGGYDDGTVMIGVIEKEEAAIARAADGNPITCLAFSPDGQSLVCGSENGTVGIINILEPLIEPLA